MSDLRLPDLNKIFIAGRLTADPEMGSGGGSNFCKLRLANTRYYKKRDGTKAEDTCFVDVTLWGKQAEWAGHTLTKGRPVLVEGSLKFDSWDDKNSGQKRSKLEINAQRLTPLDWDEDSTQAQTKPPQAKYGTDTAQPPSTSPDDDMPF